MYDFESMDKRYIIFGNIFLLANRLQAVMDAEKQEITSKQWFVLTMLGMFDTPPTLVQLAKMCDSSHQNIKQIALKLEAKGFITITQDEKDGRAMRIVKTSKCDEWELEHLDYTSDFMNRMFSTLTEEEITVLNHSQIKLYNELERMKKPE